MSDSIMKLDLAELQSLIKQKLLKSQTHPSGDLLIWCYSHLLTFDPTLWTETLKVCRGLITDREGNIVERPFTKFYNYDDSFRADIGEDFDLDFTGATIQEKMDGSLCILYKHNGEYALATKCSFTGEQALAATKLLKESGFTDFDDDYTHLFEYIGPSNRIIVDYEEDKIVYLSSVHKKTGENVIFRGFPFQHAKTYTKEEFSTYMSSKIDATKMEGFVVSFSNNKKLKFKFEEYRRIHRLLSGLSRKFIWEELSSGNRIASIVDLSLLPSNLAKTVIDYEKHLIEKAYSILSDCISIFVGTSGLDSRKEKADYIFTRIEELKLPKSYAKIVFLLLDGRIAQREIYKLIKPKNEGNLFLD
jgi:RNA ligase